MIRRIAFFHLGNCHFTGPSVKVRDRISLSIRFQKRHRQSASGPPAKIGPHHGRSARLYR